MGIVTHWPARSLSKFIIQPTMLKQLKTFLQKTQQYHILVLGVAFLLFIMTYFLTSAPPALVSSDVGGTRLASAPTGDFVPDATNVSSETSKQLEALRLRVVNAPDDTAHVYRLARLLHDSHKLEEASRNYKHYLAMHPTNRQAWLDYARSLGEQKSWEAAEGAAQEMLTYYPADPSGRYNLGAVYANLSRFEEAEAIWNEVAAQEQDSAMAAMATTSLQRLGAFVKPKWAAGQ